MPVPRPRPLVGQRPPSHKGGVPDPLFDDRLRQLRRARALRREPRPFLVERIVEDVGERLRLVNRQFGSAMVTGCPPSLRGELSQVAGQVHFADSIDALAGLEAESLDLLLVVGELDTRDELPLLLRVFRSRLAHGGFLVGAFPGGQTLPALRQALHAVDVASGSFPMRLHPRIEPAAFAGLLGEGGFVEPIVDLDRVTLRYRSLSRLIGDLRDHAATNMLLARSRKPIGKAGLQAAASAFAAAGEGGATREQVELIHFAAWVPSPNNRS